MFNFYIKNQLTGKEYSAVFPTVEEGEAWHDKHMAIHGDDDMVITDISDATIIEKLWNSCNKFCLSKIDANDRARYNAWLIDGNASQKTKIRENIAWIDGVWTEYFNRKDNLDQNYNFDSFGNPPWAFRDIAEAK
jgi:hypothetical protein